jgi:hypothetical protein
MSGESGRIRSDAGASAVVASRSSAPEMHSGTHKHVIRLVQRKNARTLHRGMAVGGEDMHARRCRRTPRIRAASSTVLARIPGTSNELAYAVRPKREQRPYVGLSPTMPQKAAGSLTDPPVSLPSALHDGDATSWAVQAPYGHRGALAAMVGSA